jgi:hypothetical protein
MRQCLFVVAAGFVCSVGLFGGGRLSAQENYTFKGNSLGMTLDDFKKQNFHGYVYYDKKGNLTKGGKKGAIQTATPVCTDNPLRLAGQPNLRVNLVADEEICPEDSPQFAGQIFALVQYVFYKGRLFQIESHFPSSGYTAVRDAFVMKYGPVDERRYSDYQNGFGANWQGEVSIWRKGSQTIVVMEGPDNGPAQDGCYYQSPDSGKCLVPKTDASAILRDDSMAPATSSPKADF